jgi:RimJ/RimL family protein N-acetyltransferase
VAPEVEGRGYATEAVRALIHHAFATGRVSQVLADTARDNLASHRVLEKAGLHRIRSDENLHYYQTEASAQATAEATA